MKQHNEKGTKEALALYRIDTAKSDLKAANANFNKNYIKNEIFSRELGRKIAGAEEIRHASDYDDFYIATKDETKEQIETAEELIAQIEVYIKKRLK